MGLNFTCNFVDCGKVGGKAPNGSWTGCLGQMKKKEFDLYPVPTFITITTAEAAE